MAKVIVSRQVSIPDTLRISRYKKIPELGPRLLFFSGGTALNGIARALKEYTHNSIHLISTFDSGGSSAELRKAFDMPAIGDLRSRLLALADESVLGHQVIYRLFNHRLAKTKTNDVLKKELQAMILLESNLIVDIPDPMKTLIGGYLDCFYHQMPTDFDLRGASIGNLILVGGYLSLGRKLDQIIYLFSQLVAAKGTVRPISQESCHLVASLDNGEKRYGQHSFTGKDEPAITSPIKAIRLSRSLHSDAGEAMASLSAENIQQIAKADAICYPPGSFYSSVIANLLPLGTGDAIANNPCPKVYLPNLGTDPEQLGLSLFDQIEKITDTLSIGSKRCTELVDFISIVLVDKSIGIDASCERYKHLSQQGIQFVETDLSSKVNNNKYDETKVANALLSLI